MIDNINNGIVVCNNIDKENLLSKYYNDKKIVDFKILDINEFISNMTYSYDTKAIYFIMKNYEVNYDVASIYLKNIIYVNEFYDDDKLQFLYNLKKELIDNNLIKENRLFKNYIKNKKIIFYNLNYDNKFLSFLCHNLDYEFINDEVLNNYSKKIYHFESMQDEIVYVANNIVSLLNDGIDISKIKVIISNEYKYLIKIIFDAFNLKVNTFNSSLYSTEVCKCFLENLKENVSESIDILREKYDSYVISDIVDICNKYYWCDNFLEIKDMLIEEFKHKKIKYDRLSDEIEIIDYMAIKDDSNYYFFMGFNNENIPISYKDTEYINDSLCFLVNKETSNDRFLREKYLLIKKIKCAKNMIITYKDKSYFSDYLISNLNDELGYQIVDGFIDLSLSYSELESQIRLARKLDLFDKYGVLDDDLKLLYNNISSKYKTYDNKFKGIDINDLYEFLNNKLLLSYSSVDNYYKCAFRYYINNVLKLDEFEDSFSTYVGSLMHYMLSIYRKKDFNFEKEFSNYLEEHYYEFSNKDKFFLDKIKDYLKFIMREIDNQRLLTGFDKELYEKKIFIEKNNKIKITFMGVIDKIMYLEKDGETYLSIIDYKTGYINTNLKYIDYGFDLQLPTYAYLIKNSNLFNNPVISGLYYQKLLDNEIKATDLESYEKSKKDNLKLEGISTTDESVLGLFDSTYENSDLIKNMKMTKNGFYSYAKVFSNEELEDKLRKTEEKIDEAIRNIIAGNFLINPKRIGKENVGCAFCKYKDICYMKEDNVVVLEEGDSDAEMDE